jgi:hypothetical protein
MQCGTVPHHRAGLVRRHACAPLRR